MSDEPTIDSPPEGYEGWSEVWKRDLRFRTRRSAPARWIAGLVRRILGPDFARQRDFNVALLEMLGDVRRDVEALRADVQVDLESIRSDVESVAKRVDERIRLAADRNDALIAALDRRQESLSIRLRDVTNPIVRGEAPGAGSRDDFLYRRLEDGLRGGEAEIREALSVYVDLAAEHAPVVDVGCGRGEFLELCRSKGIEARGFDTNERAIADLVARGLRAEVAPIPDCFSPLADASVGSILATHVVEHLPVGPLFSLFAESWRVLRPGGLLMIETPNARSIAVSATEFWRDPTHLAPRHVGALTLIAREIGFAIDDVSTVHPHPAASRIEIGEGHPRDLQEAFDRLNGLLFGDQDLRLVLRKQIED